MSPVFSVISIGIISIAVVSDWSFMWCAVVRVVPQPYPEILYKPETHPKAIFLVVCDPYMYEL